MADQHLAINPGSDLALALGLMHVIIGEKLYDADYVERYTNGFDDLRDARRDYPPERVAALTGIAAAGNRPAGARVRHHASSGDSAELRRAAQRAGRRGGAGHRWLFRR